MSAMYASVCEALILPNPGNPGVGEVEGKPAPLIWFPFRSTRFTAAFVIWYLLRDRLGVPAPSCGATYRWPNSARYPLYPPGSFGSRSPTAVALGVVCPNLIACALAQNGSPVAQCTPMPT